MHVKHVIDLNDMELCIGNFRGYKHYLHRFPLSVTTLGLHNNFQFQYFPINVDHVQLHISLNLVSF